MDEKSKFKESEWTVELTRWSKVHEKIDIGADSVKIGSILEVPYTNIGWLDK